MRTILYRVRLIDPAAHLLEINLYIKKPRPSGQRLRLPAWIPGSYMIRDFARHIVEISAWGEKKQLSLTKEDKHTWIVEPFNGTIQIRYQVYAWDLSVRAAHVDQTHAFLNGSSVFLSVEGKEDQAHLLDIVRPMGALYKKWRVATSLLELTAKRYDFGRYIARNYDDLIDHPIEMGEFKKLSFNAYGIKHDIIITGKVVNLDAVRLCTDLKKICETQIAFFDPIQKKAPMERYVFLMMVVGEGYGGLEHRSSTALLCSRTDFPVLGDSKMSDAYCTLLGLCSHEYFHTWNVKRIKPAAFVPYQLFSETYTSLLWLFEGGTSYYDDLMLLRSGVIDETRYFSLLAKTINSVLSTPGRFKQSVAEASFDAWDKYYKQDENSPNVTISYYTKGALVNLLLDLTIRIQTKGKKSLDDVMRALWEKYGKNFYIKPNQKQGQGVTEETVRALFDKVTGLSLGLFFEQYVDDVVELPLLDLLNQVGISLKQEESDEKAGLGVKIKNSGGLAQITCVYTGSSAQDAGLSAGDILVALDDIRVTFSNWNNLLERYRVGEKLCVMAYRGDVLRAFWLEARGDNTPKWCLAR